jgi:protein DGCR14
MFAPDADVSPHVPTGFDKSQDPKIIKHGNTRLSEQDETATGTSEPASPTRSRIDAAISGTECKVIQRGLCQS